MNHQIWVTQIIWQLLTQLVLNCVNIQNIHPQKRSNTRQPKSNLDYHALMNELAVMQKEDKRNNKLLRGGNKRGREKRYIGGA